MLGFFRDRKSKYEALDFERPIALETGRVLKQREMQARLILETLSLFVKQRVSIWMLVIV